jgi:hypothetical protein
MRVVAALAFACGSSATVCVALGFGIPPLRLLGPAGMILSLPGTICSFIALCLERRAVPSGHWVSSWKGILMSVALNAWPWVSFVWVVWVAGLLW